MRFLGDARRDGTLPSTLLQMLLPSVHSSRPRYEREESNRHFVRQNCAAIIVTPELLATCIDENGVDRNRAFYVVTALILDAHRRQVANTLGVEVE
jgi:hypothetical protein